jgi:hypothetical protein
VFKKSLSEDPWIYRRHADGSIDIWKGLYNGGHISGASQVWQQMKIERLLRLADAGVTFFMFDFLSYVRAGVDLRTQQPMYLHIHCGQDNQQMLTFWWYASTCRHLGIGGVKDEAEPLYQALKHAVATYRRLKPFFTRGRFIGVDTYIHGHALPEREAAIFVLFNLGSMPVTRTVDLAAEELGIRTLQSTANAGAELNNGRISFTVAIAPLSPLIVEVNTLAG